MTDVRLEIDGPVAILTLDAPERRNALRTGTARDVIEACDAIDGNHAVGAVVVRGAGGYFCAGADRELLDAAGRDPAGEEAFDDLSLVYRAFVRVGELAAPTVAAVRGGAVGAGVNLALATDLRVVGEDARLISGFLRIGMHPGGGHFTLVGRAAGREAAAALGLFGEEISGRRAVALGLAWDAVSDGDVEARALELARRVARDPALARAATRSLRLELGPPGTSWPVALEAERGQQIWSLRRR